MIVYSAMPVEMIFEGVEIEPHLTEVHLGGVTLVVEPISQTQCKVVRLISPDPYDYLNPGYSPGQVLHFRPDVY